MIQDSVQGSVPVAGALCEEQQCGQQQQQFIPTTITNNVVSEHMVQQGARKAEKGFFLAFKWEIRALKKNSDKSVY
jgi:hypothetical protein